VPRELTVYVRHVNVGLGVPGASVTQTIVNIGDSAFASVPRLRLFTQATTPRVGINYNDGTNNREVASADVTGMPTLGAVVEVRGVLNSLGGVIIHGSADGNAEASSGTSAASTLPAAFAEPRLYLAGTNVGETPKAITHVAIALGTQTRATMRRTRNITTQPITNISVGDKIVHTGDIDTAIRFPANDTVTIETAGSERLRVDSGGNVGIGTTSPSQALEVSGSIAVGTQASKATISYATNTARTLTIPNVGGNRTFAFIDQAQTISAAQTFSSTPLTLSAATAVLTFSSATGNKTISTAANTNLILSPGGTGNVGVNTTSPTYKLEVNGSFAATTKSFIIDHQELYGKKLVYGVLEGPEHAVYVRGKLTNTSIIQLPDEWSWLVDMDSITVQLTPIGKHQQLYVDHIGDDYIVVKNSAMFDKSVTCYYLIHATRKDVEPLQTVV
jgi:hypothetical protein